MAFYPKYNPRRNALVFSSLIIAATSSLWNLSSFAQEDAGKIIGKVRSTYDNLASLHAEFEKQYTWALAGETQTVTGKIYLKKGERYRIETEDQTVVTDGVTVWTYSSEKQQVFVDRMEKSSENPLPRDLLVKYTSDFKPKYLRGERLAEKDCHVIRLTPREDDSFATEVTVWVDKSTMLAIQVEQHDLNDNVTVYRLRKIELNPSLPDKLFTFDIPQNTEVIDLRKS